MSPAIDSVNHCAAGEKLNLKLIPDTYKYDLSFLTPIDRLPIELLIDIFVLCAHSPDHDPRTPVILSRVCRYWQEIVFNSPRVWQIISLDDRHLEPVERSHPQALEWLARSGSLPVELRVRLSNVDMLLPLLCPLLPHMDRWRRLTITGAMDEDVDFAAFSQNGSLADLDSVQLTIRGVSDLHEYLQDRTTYRQTLFSSRLSYFSTEIHKVFMRLSVLSLPPPHLLCAVHLQSLTIVENNVEVTHDPVRLLEFLSVCNSLENLSFYGFPHEPSPADPPASPPMVSLPRLRVLVLRSTCSVRTILSHIIAPALTELYLEHTNMEFELHHAAAYIHEPEEGDSEDEAHDFSQSPWSDHATGMGLRAFITRSKPPLEILEMDYADMRTKDFLWCFNKLSRLQEFRIVASDMSDKVIAMLAPFRDRAGGAGAESEEDEAEDGPLRVRLPRLSSLELWNCQRLSGDAIVNALQSRASFAERMADGEVCAKFRDVAVIACTGFQPRHVVTLAPALGGNLRLH